MQMVPAGDTCGEAWNIYEYGAILKRCCQTVGVAAFNIPGLSRESVLSMLCFLGCVQKLRQSRLGPDEDVRQVWQSLKSVLEELDQQCWSEDESEVLVAEGHELEAALATDDPVLESSSCAADVAASGTEESGCPAPRSASEDKPHVEAAARTVAPPQGHRAEVEGTSPCSGQGGSPGQKRAPVLVRLGSVCEVVLQWGRSLVGSNLESLQFLLGRLRTAARQHKMFAGQLEAVSASLEADVVRQYGSRITLKTALYR